MIRSIIAVLGGIGLTSLLSEVLEFTLVNAAAGSRIASMADYFAVRDRPAIAAGRLASTGLAAVLGGYMCAKVASEREMLHATVAALVQTAALVWGFTTGEYAAYTPVWLRVALVLTTGPAMVGGAAIRRGAREAGDAHIG